LVVEFWDGYDKIQSYIEDGVINAYQCIGIKPEVKTQDLYEDIIKKYENPVNADEPVFFYHSDHLGSASYITDENGNPTQHLVYLPFGEDWVDLKYNTTQFETPYKFNGKEKDEETGYNYYGARYYSDNLSIFLSTDPLSDKFPNLSSYAYCTNNPVMLIDPDGRDVVLTREDGRKYNYGKDPKYDGTDKFILQGIATLDKINSTEAGGKLLSNLIGSEGVYNITNGSSEEGTGNFLGNKNGKGGTLNMNGDMSLTTLSHELFHGYQHENGQGGASIFNEVESYLFQDAVNMQYNSTKGYSNGAYGISKDRNSKEGKSYENSITNLLYGKFSNKDFNKAVNLFKSQSQANDGLYNNYKYLRRPNQKQNLIERFYPLVK
jgi:RHS repeat-associated protein